MEKHFVMALPDFQALVDTESIHKATPSTYWSAVISTPEGNITTTFLVIKHEEDYTIVRKTTIETPRYNETLKIEHSETYKLYK